jgi:TolC family type I secretion outer membrane protein
LLLFAVPTTAVAQAGEPNVLPVSTERQIEAVREALRDPALAPPGQTLRDVALPTKRLSMENALRRALTNHPDLQVAMANIESQEYGVTASTAARYPKFNFSTNIGQSGSSGQLGGQEVIRTGIQRAYGFGIGLSQQLLDFGRTHYRIKIAELELATTRLSYLDTRQNVINNVVQAYFNLLREAQGIQVGIENVRNAELLVEQARGFLEAGTRAKIELIRAEAGLANAKFLLVQAEGGYGRALAALASALGEDQLPQEMPEPFTLELPEWDVDTVRSLARRERPDLIIASLRVAQADARVQAARAEYYPSISVGAGYNWSDSVFPPVNTAYNVGISLNVPLINEPELSSAVGAAQADWKAASASLKSSELLVVEEATAALYTLREAVGSSEASGEGLRSAEENFRLATERYRVGVGNSLEVSEAQRLLVEARSVELQARYNVQTAIGNLLLATGQLDGQAILSEDLRLEPIFDIPEEVIPGQQPARPKDAPQAVPLPGGETVEDLPAPSPDSRPPSDEVPKP